MTFDVVYRNERDVEVPLLLRAAYDLRGKVGSYLDVGANYSYATYAGAMRQILGGVLYYACDPLPCEKTAKIVDTFLTADVRDLSHIQCDFVSCISVLEHVGIQTPRLHSTLRSERSSFFHKLCRITSHRLFVTFPFGKDGTGDGYANLTQMNIGDFIGVADRVGLVPDVKYYFNEFPQGGKTWAEITENEAVDIPLVRERGVQCVCVFDAKRKQDA